MFSFLFQIQQSFPDPEGIISEVVERPRMLYSWGSLHIKGNVRSGEEQVHIEEEIVASFPFDFTAPSHIYCFISGFLSPIDILMLLLKRPDSSLGVGELSCVL